MGFDRNTVIGFALLAVLFMGYFWYVSGNQKALTEMKKRQEDSLAALKPRVDTFAYRQDSLRQEKIKDSAAAGSFQEAASGTEVFTYIENDLMRLTFTNKGGWLKMVELKKFKGADSQLVKMGGTADDGFGYDINTGTGVINTSKLYFNPAVVNKTPSGAQTVSYQVTGPDGKAITHSFVVRPDDYMVDGKLDLKGASQLVSQQAVSLYWNNVARRQQSNIEYERQQTRLVYRTGEEYDYNSALSAISEKLEKPTQWVGLKQQFFNSTLLVKNNMNGVQADVTPSPETDTTIVAKLKMTARIPLDASTDASIDLQLYSGPNDYYILKKYDNDMYNIVDLGSGIMAFVKYVNRWLIMPVFSFLDKIMGNAAMGWTILLLTIFIRLLIAPLTYSSYLSGAKMKALRPEIEALKKKTAGDQQAMSMEQMKLFREAGVNPLGGCIPALFQIPIFFALYSFFNSNIELRGVPFLWANDLSSYDSILNFPFSIPFYGSHISLFTITACLTSFAISLYSMSTTPDTGNPMMKYMPYIFPFMMLFIFNRLPSALTWYYTVSNVITLILQFVIQTYIIDHEKVLAKITASRAAPKKKSKLAERMEAMQESQRKLEELKKKGKK